MKLQHILIFIPFLWACNDKFAKNEQPVAKVFDKYLLKSEVSADEVVVDVTSLGVGKAIKVQDIHVEGVELMNAKSVVVAQVKLTRAARAAQSAQ